MNQSPSASQASESCLHVAWPHATTITDQPILSITQNRLTNSPNQDLLIANPWHSSEAAAATTTVTSNPVLPLSPNQSSVFHDIQSNACMEELSIRSTEYSGALTTTAMTTSTEEINVSVSAALPPLPHHAMSNTLTNIGPNGFNGNLTAENTIEMMPLNAYQLASRTLIPLFQDPTLIPSNLVKLVTDIIMFQDMHIGGPHTRNQDANVVSKIPRSFFYQLYDHQKLIAMLTILLNVRAQCHLLSFNFGNPDQFVQHLKAYELLNQALVSNGMFNFPRVYFYPEWIEKPSVRSELVEIIRRHGGTVVETESEATHCVVVSVGNDIRRQLEKGRIQSEIHDEKLGGMFVKLSYVRPLRQKDQQVLIHWWYYPDSYDMWVPEEELRGIDDNVLNFYQPKQNVVRLTERWIRDLQYFNEWMNELDYDPLESTILTKKTTYHISSSAEEMLPWSRFKNNYRALTASNQGTRKRASQEVNSSRMIQTTTRYDQNEMYKRIKTDDGSIGVSGGVGGASGNHSGTVSMGNEKRLDRVNMEDGSQSNPPSSSSSSLPLPNPLSASVTFTGSPHHPSPSLNPYHHQSGHYPSTITNVQTDYLQSSSNHAQIHPTDHHSNASGNRNQSAHSHICNKSNMGHVQASNYHLQPCSSEPSPSSISHPPPSSISTPSTTNTMNLGGGEHSNLHTNMAMMPTTFPTGASCPPSSLHSSSAASSLHHPNPTNINTSRLPPLLTSNNPSTNSDDGTLNILRQIQTCGMLIRCGITGSSSTSTSSQSQMDNSLMDTNMVNQHLGSATSFPLPSDYLHTSAASILASSSLNHSTSHKTHGNGANWIHLKLMPHSTWFNINQIHDIEKQALPEFFVEHAQTRSTNKTPEIYQEYRDFMIYTYQQNPAQYLTFTACRRSLAGDACALLRVYDFLEYVSLINYAIDTEHSQLDPILSPDEMNTITKPLSSESKRNIVSNTIHESSILSGMKHCSSSPRHPTPPPRDNFGNPIIVKTESLATPTIHPTQIPPNPISSSSPNLIAKHASHPNLLMDTKMGHYASNVDDALHYPNVPTCDDDDQPWSNKETIRLLSAIDQYFDDWDKIAECVGSRSKESCIFHFVHLPLQQQDALTNLQASLFRQNHPSTNDVINNENKTDLNQIMSTMIKGGEHGVQNPIQEMLCILSGVVPPEIASATVQAAFQAYFDLEKHSAVPMHLSQSKNSTSEGNPIQDDKNLPIQTGQVPELQSEHSSETNVAMDQDSVQIGQNPLSTNPTSASLSSLDPTLNNGVSNVIVAASSTLAISALKAAMMSQTEDRYIDQLIYQVIQVMLEKIELKFKYFDDLEELLKARIAPMFQL